MIKIKLQRRGKKGEAHYRVVVSEAAKPRDSKFIDDLGYYNPHVKENQMVIDQEKATKWLKNGAQPTETVAQFFVKLGLVKQIHKGSKPGKQKPKKKAAEAPKA